MVVLMEDLTQGIPVVNSINIVHMDAMVVINLRENNLSGIIQDSSLHLSKHILNTL